MADLPPNRYDEVDPESEFGRILFDDDPDALTDWIGTYLTVPNELGRIVQMKPFPQQKAMAVNTTGRDITVKGRQTRASSFFMARNTRRMTNGSVWGANCVVGAQDDQTTAFFRQRIRHHIFNDLKNKGFDFTIAKDNNDELVIAELDNRFLFVSGEQKTMVRGFSGQIIHFSEFAHWKDSALELLGGALPAVPAPPYGWIDLESTPKGEQGAFYEKAQDARPINPQSLWTVHLYQWWMEPRYRVSDQPDGSDIVLSKNLLYQLETDFMPTDHEAHLMSAFKLSVRQILWRRYKKHEMDATPTPFLQEYPEDLDTCWLGVQGRFFDTPDGMDHLEYYRDSRRDPVRYFEKLPYRGAEISFYGPNLAVWEFPDPADTYVCGFDAAGGGIGKDSDWSVLYVMSVRKEKVVARLRVQASPKAFASMACAVGTMYNSAMVNGERSHHGDVVFSEMQDLHYRNIYYHVDPIKGLAKNERLQPGIYPTALNRQMVLEKLKTGVTHHALESKCSELVREMNVFTWQKYQQRMKAAAIDITGQHDDCVFAVAQAWYVIDKARNIIQSRDRDMQEVILSGSNGMIVRRSERDEYNEALWRQV